MYRTYTGTGVLGLVANNDVDIYRPVSGAGVNQSGSIANPTAEAAVLSLARSFSVQNWSKGAPPRPRSDAADRSGGPSRRAVYGRPIEECCSLA